MTDELHIQRRRLPHWTLKGSTYFITWRLARGVRHLGPAEKDIIVESLMHFHNERYRLLAYVVMDDHVHVIARPLKGFELPRLVHGWKSLTANRINKLRGTTGRFWLDERYDRLIRNEQELVQKLEYIVTNPVRRWPETREYPWVGWFADE